MMSGLVFLGSDTWEWKWARRVEEEGTEGVYRKKGSRVFYQNLLSPPGSWGREGGEATAGSLLQR